VKLGRPIMAVYDKPDIGIPVEQQRRCRPLEQAICPNQINCARLTLHGEQRQGADQTGHQPYRAQANWIGAIDFVQLRLIAARKSAGFAAFPLKPHRHEWLYGLGCFAAEPPTHAKLLRCQATNKKGRQTASP
jgi:hypothetical protein